jgi:hypothetical protein
MRIDSRLARIERELGTGQDGGPFILVLTQGPVPDDPEYKARLRRRIAETVRQHPNDPFRLLL